MDKSYIICDNKPMYMVFTIIEFDYMDVLFVLKDDNNQLYLGLCAESRGFMRWVIAKTDVHTIKAVIDKKITINDALGSDNGVLTVVEYHSDKGYSSRAEHIDTINPYDLTKPGLYARYMEEDVDGNLQLLLEGSL